MGGKEKNIYKKRNDEIMQYAMPQIQEPGGINGLILEKHNQGYNLGFHF